MNGWIVSRLGDIAKTQYGLSVPMNEDGKGFKIFRMGEVQNGRLIDSGRMKCAAISAKDFEQYKLRVGDVLFNRTNSFELVGKTGIFDLEGDYCFASYLVRLNLDRSKVLPEFLNYFMNSDRFQKTVKEKASRSINQANINATILSNELIQFPASIPEQKRIVGILDETLDAIATAKANAEKNLQNSRALFENHLHSIIAKVWETCELVKLLDVATDITDGDHLPPPKSPSGIPFITIGNIVKDTRKIDFTDTFMVSRTYYDGLKANKKPKKGDVLYTVTGSFGIPVILNDDVEFCFQRHIGLIRPKPETSSAWLYYLLSSPQVFKQANDGATGTAQKTVSLKLLREIKVPRVTREFQLSAVAKLDALSAATRKLESLYQRKLDALDVLKKSLLHQAFTGQLTRRSGVSITESFPARITNITTTDLHAGILAMAYELHEKHGKQTTFGHVKAEKIAHMVEAYAGIELERSPVKDAAGPNDYPHLKRVEHRAKKAGFFSFDRVEGSAYRVTKYRNFDGLIVRTCQALGDRKAQVEKLLKLMLPMSTQQAEIFSTVYAAWNNLLLDRQTITDEKIVLEARDHWHPDKMRIPRENFFKAIKWMRENDFVPAGKGKKVSGKAK